MTEAIVRIKFDARKTFKALRGIAEQQFPFAYAKALTETAKMAQVGVRLHTRQVFKLHTEYIPRGILVEHAQKRDFKVSHSASSAVYTSRRITGFMAWHERGGVKRPQRKKLAIPGPGLTSKSESKWKTTTGRVRRSMKPKNLLAQNKMGRPKKRKTLNKRPFVIPKRGTSPAMIVRRIARGPRSLEVLYVFRRQAKINPVWDFEKTTRRIANRMFPKMFRREWKQALATAGRGGV